MIKPFFALSSRVSEKTPEKARRPKRRHGRLVPAILCLPAGMLVLPGSTDRLKPEMPDPRVPEAALTEPMRTAPSDVSRIELKTEPTRAETLRLGFYRLGAPLKALLSLPFLLFGQVLLSAVKRALRLTAGPALSFFATFLFCSALLFGLFALVFRLLFPDRPLKDLFKNRRWLTVLGAAFALTAVYRLYRLYRRSRLLFGLTLLAAAFALLCLLYKKLFRNVPPPERTKKWIELPRF